MAIATTSTLSALIQVQMGRALQAALSETLFWPGGPLFGMMRTRDLTGDEGIAATFPIFGSLTAYDTIEGSDIATVDSLTDSSTTVTATEKQVPTYVTNLALQALRTPNALNQRMADEAQAHIAAHAAKFDADVMALASSLTSGYSATGANLTIAGVMGGIKKLAEANAPKPYVGVLSVQQWYDLTTEASSAMISAAQGGSMAEEMWQGWSVPRFLGVNWFVVPSIAGAIDSTDDWGMILSNRALGCTIVQLPGQGGVDVVDLPKARSKMISSVSTYGVGVVESTMGVYLQTGTS